MGNGKGIREKQETGYIATRSNPGPKRHAGGESTLIGSIEVMGEKVEEEVCSMH
jgi:hypothetical protein